MIFYISEFPESKYALSGKCMRARARVCVGVGVGVGVGVCVRVCVLNLCTA